MLAVGDSTQLEIIFNTGMNTNKVTKAPTITTNEGPPNKMVRIICDVLTRPDSTYPIVIKPYKLDLTQFGEKLRDEIKFTIQNVSQQALTPKLISAAPDFLDVELPKQIAAGKTAEGIVKVRKSALDKPFDKSFTMQLNDDKNTRFTVPVKRAVRSAATAAQPNVATPSPTGH